MDLISIAPDIAKTMIAYNYAWKPADFLLKNIFGFGLKNAFVGSVNALTAPIGKKAEVLYNATLDKGFIGRMIPRKIEYKKSMNSELLNKKNGIVFNKAIFNNAKFIGAKNSSFGNGSKKGKFSIRDDERASELSRYVKNDLIPYTKHEIKPYHTKIDIKSGVSSGIKKSGLLSIIRKLSSKLSTIGFILSSAKDIVTSFLNTNGFIHKGINTLGGLITGDHTKDYSARLFGNGIVKGEAWIANKLGIIDDDKLKYAYKAVDNYIQNSDDYINGKTDKTPEIGRMGNYNPTNNVTVNIDKIEKDVDSDALIDRLSDIMDSWNDRNAIGTPIY